MNGPGPGHWGGGGGSLLYSTGSVMTRQKFNSSLHISRPNGFYCRIKRLKYFNTKLFLFVSKKKLNGEREARTKAIITNVI
jgi:hypothetical protein